MFIQTSVCVKRTLALLFHRITSELVICKISVTAIVFYLTLTKTYLSKFQSPTLDKLPV